VIFRINKRISDAFGRISNIPLTAPGSPPRIGAAP
jgi:hypothetical protein